MHSQTSYTIVLAAALFGVVVTLAQTPPQAPGSTVPGVPAPGQPAARGSAPTPTTGTGRIRGRVVSDTGAPLPRVQIRLSPPAPGQQLLTATDEQGRYEFQDLPAVQYSASAALGGYVTMRYGQRSPNEPARQVRVTDGEVADRIDFTLPRGGAIVVQVSDEFGDPMAGFRAQVERYAYVNGQRRLTLVSSGVGPLAETDDRGLVRTYGLPPGEYVVSATLGILASVRPGGRSERSYLQTYYPQAYTPEQADRVTLGLGQEITVPIGMRAIRIPKVTGVLRKANGEPAAQMNPTLGGRGTVTAPDGSFTFTGVAPGNYVLDLAPSRPGSVNAGNADVLRMPIAVGSEDLTGITAVLRKGGTVQGSVIFEGGATPSGLRPAALQVTVTEPGGPPAPAAPVTLSEDWTFSSQALIGMRVLRLRQAPEGVFLKAVMLDGRDVIDTPLDFNDGKDVKDLEVVLTQKAASVSGTVTDAQGATPASYAVAVFPADRAQWTSYSRFIVAGRPDQQGRFRAAGLPAGRYLAAAVDYLDNGEERDPELLERLSRNATALTLTEGEARNLSLRIVVR